MRATEPPLGRELSKGGEEKQDVSRGTMGPHRFHSQRATFHVEHSGWFHAITPRENRASVHAVPRGDRHHVLHRTRCALAVQIRDLFHVEHLKSDGSRVSMFHVEHTCFSVHARSEFHDAVTFCCCAIPGAFQPIKTFAMIGGSQSVRARSNLSHCGSHQRRGHLPRESPA
jgi:hypothetical protein